MLVLCEFRNQRFCCVWIFKQLRRKILLNSKGFKADCATNPCNSQGCWGSSMTCWNDPRRWARTSANIVRCVNKEGSEPTKQPTQAPTKAPTTKQSNFASCK